MARLSRPCISFPSFLILCFFLCNNKKRPKKRRCSRSTRMNWSRPTTLGTPPSVLTKGLSQTGAHLIGAKIYLLNENLDIYVFDTRTLYWSKPATFGVQPLPCVSFASALVGEKLYVFGGLR